MRLDKFLSSSGGGSRSEVKIILKKGRVSVNGTIVKDPAYNLDVNADTVLLDNVRVNYEEFRYYMFNKPAGCVSATKDGLSETVIDYFKGEITKDLFPVGRLDKDTEGLLLITNDGKLAHNLLSPKRHVDKTYLAYVDKKLTKEETDAFSAGIDIGDDKPTLPARITMSSDNEEGAYLYEVVIHEGRYHQVKRMFEAFGSRVVNLKRISMGTLILDSKLKPGEYRRLTRDEVDKLKGV